MSATASSNSKTNEPTSSISDAEDKKMFQAVRRTGRRNALGDLSEQLAQASGSSTSSEVDKMAPHFQSMSIKH